jgi:signal transduction histidine kinase
MTAGPVRSVYNKQHLVLLLVVCSLAVGGLYFLAVPAWLAFQTAVGFHTLLAFLSIMCSAALLAHYTYDKRTSKVVLQAAFLFSGIQNIGAAVLVHYEVDYAGLTSSRFWMFGDISYVALFGGLILVSVVLRIRGTELRRPIGIVLVLSLGSLIFIGFFVYVAVPTMPDWSLQPIALVLGLLASATITLSGYLWSRLPDTARDFEVEFMAAGFTLFGLSWIPSVASLIAPSIVWTLGYEMRTIGLFVLLLGLELPYLRQVGMRGRNAFFFTSGLPMLAFLPVTLTVLAEAFAPGLTFVNPEVYQLAHLGAASTSAVMAFLIMSYSRQRSEWNRTPLIALFLVWSAIEIWLLAYTYVPQWWMTGEVLIPYIVGSVVMIVLLPIAVRWGQDPKWAQRKTVPTRTLLMIVVFTLILVFVGQLIQTVLESAVTGLQGSPFGRSFLLTTNLLIIFAFMYLELSYIRSSRGRITLDVVVLGFLALWIVPIILKGIYLVWTAGWWAAEIFLLLALAFGPAVLGMLYMRELNRAEKTQQRATLYADLLAHDISNYHQAVLVCLGLLKENLSDVKALGIVEDADQQLTRADHLIRNVRRLGMIDDMRLETLRPIDMVAFIENAFELVARHEPSEGQYFYVSRKRNQCFILANDFFMDIMLNLFRNSIEYANDEVHVEVEIDPLERHGRDYWVVHVSDRSRGIEPQRRVSLFERYMDGAQGTGLGLSVVKALVDAFEGEITVGDRIPGDHTKGTIFTLVFPRFAGTMPKLTESWGPL